MSCQYVRNPSPSPANTYQSCLNAVPPVDSHPGDHHGCDHTYSSLFSLICLQYQSWNVSILLFHMITSIFLWCSCQLNDSKERKSISQIHFILFNCFSSMRLPAASCHHPSHIRKALSLSRRNFLWLLKMKLPMKIADSFRHVTAIIWCHQSL